MKGPIAIFVVTLAAAAFAGQCPTDQADKWEVDLLLPHPDCDKFFKCTYGEPVDQGCPFGLLYNIESEQCDWPENVDCGSRYVEAENPERPERPEAPQKPERPEAPQKPERPEAPQKPERPEAPQKPERPEAPEKPERPEAPQKPERPEAPQSPEESEQAEESEQVDEEADSEGASSSESAEVIEFLPNGCPASAHVHWLLPSKLVCRWFYYCVNGHRELRTCAKGLHFNSELQVCDWPERAGCSSLLALEDHE